MEILIITFSFVSLESSSLISEPMREEREDMIPITA